MSALKTYCTRNRDILGKDDALELNDEEVDKLFHILYGGFESFLWDGVILAGTERRCQTPRKDYLAGDLSEGSDCHQRQKSFLVM